MVDHTAAYAGGFAEVKQLIESHRVGQLVIPEAAGDSGGAYPSVGIGEKPLWISCLAERDGCGRLAAKAELPTGALS